MNQENFEQTLREKFENFSSDYKADISMWDSIESQLDPRPKNRKRFLIFITSLGVAISSFILYFQASDKLMDDSISEQELKIDYNLECRLAKASDRHHDGRGSYEQSSKVLLESSQRTDNQDLDSESFALDASGDEDIVDDPAVHVSNKVILAMRESIGVKATSESDLIWQDESKEVMVRAGVSEVVPLLKIRSLGIEFIRDHVELDMTTTILDHSSRDQRKNFSVGLTVGSSMLQSSYSLNDPAYQAVLEQRQKSESPGTQYSLGMEVEYDFSRSWSLLIGANMSFVQNEFFSESNEFKVDSIPNHKRMTTTMAGRDTTIVGTLIRQTRRNIKTWKYSDRLLLRIPILISYNKSLGPKSNIGFGLGTETVFYQSIKGEELDLNGEFYDLENDKENRYGRKGASALFRFNYNYQITENWDLRVMADYRKSIRSNYTADAPIQKSFNSVSLSLGSHFTF